MKVLFRVDASRQIGLGHLMRCLALAEALKERNCDPFFLTRDSDGTGINMIRKNGFKKIEIMVSKADLRGDFNILKMMAFKHGIGVIVTDSYNLTNAYYRDIKKTGFKLLVIDDFGGNHIPADIILNQNIYADRLAYSRNSKTKLLLGPRYALLKKPFSIYRDRYKLKKYSNKILVTLGGGEKMEGCIIKMVRAIEQLGQSNLHFRIIGRLKPALKNRLKNNSIRFDLKDIVNNIWEDMLWADLAICGGGTTTYELCCLGVPFMTVIVADNQEFNAELLERENISINLGWYNKLNTEEIKIKLSDLIDDYKRRTIMSKNARKLVNGKGAGRVSDEILG